MQNPKSSPSDPKATRKQPLVSDAVTGTCSNLASKALKDASHKAADRKSPRVASAEKKKPSKDSELESQLAHLQEEFKKAKEQLSSNESLKIRYQKEVEEAKKKLFFMSAKLQETEQQLDEVSESEEARVQELRKISHDRDKAWQSELEAMQRQHIMDSNALASAMNEIKRLKARLQRISQWEASQAGQAEAADAQIRSLSMELQEAVVAVGKLEAQLNDSRESEARAIEGQRVAQEQLEAIKASEETLRSDLAKAMESKSSLSAELEQSHNRLRSLEKHIECHDENRESEVLILRNEVSRLRESLKEAERLYQEEYIHSKMEIKNAYEFVEQLKSAYDLEDAQSKAKIKESIEEVEGLRKRLMEAENDLQESINRRDSELELKLMKSEAWLENLNASLIEKEVELQIVLEQNAMLKSDIIKSEKERINANEMVIAPAATEEESLTTLGSLSVEIDPGFRKSEPVTCVLDPAQASKAEMEMELRTLKVQCDQWRKAAEMAAAMLSTGTDAFTLHSLGRGLSSSNLEETDEDSPKKRNSNMLKKISVLLKKGQK